MFEDYGYSNYTVEGTNISCILNLNPDFPQDNWYGESPSHKYAEKCHRYAYNNGRKIHFDVDREDGELRNYVSDEEVLAWMLLTNWGD